MARIGYGRYQIAAASVVTLLEYAQGVEVIVIGIYEKYLINESELSVASISLLCTFISFGFTFGLICSLFLAARLGRLSMLKLSYAIVLTTAFCSSLTKNTVAFFLLRITTNVGIGIGAPIVFTYFIESSPSYNRGYLSVLVDFMYNLGEFFVLALTYFLMPGIHGDNWFWVLFTPYFFVIISSFMAFFYLKESPWNLSKTERNEELINILEFISYQNTGICLSEEEKISAKTFHATETSFMESCKILLDKKHIGTILKIAWMRVCLLVGYVGIIFFIPFLFSSETFYLSYAICIISNIPMIIAIFLVIETNYFGRKNTLIFSMCTLSVLSASMLFFQNNETILAIIIGSICGISSVSTTVTSLFVVELHETNIRVAASSVTHFIARLQMLYIIYVLVLLTNTPTVLFAVFTLVYLSGALCALSIRHDTRGRQLDLQGKDA